MRRIELTDGWRLTGTQPGRFEDPEGLSALPDDAWIPAVVPGTVAGAVGLGPAPADLDARDWWYRCRVPPVAAAAEEEVVLALDGIATLADVYLDGRLILHSESMFAAHEVEVGDRLRAESELAVCVRALAPRLAERRRPRARWRTRVVSNGNLRFVRTMLLGRVPGFAPGPPVVGVWRPVALVVRGPAVLEQARVRATVDVARSLGRIEVSGTLRAVRGGPLPETLRMTIAGDDEPPESSVADGAGLSVDANDGRVSGHVDVPQPRLWWPHTHGEPALYTVTIWSDGSMVHRARVGFRELRGPSEPSIDGIALEINGVPIFARGAVWTPLGLVDPHATRERARPVLEHLVHAGLNMVRVPGTATYESDAFHDLCDELGLLVLQDFMFANLDYPESDDAFMAAVAGEVRALLQRLGHRPSLAALCGSSEVAQQVAMLGLDPSLAAGPLYGELLPGLIAEAGIDVPYVPSAPWGGELPFRPNVGVANYYGVGAYLRPLEDARRADVRFATECLAFANVPDDAALADLDAGADPSAVGPAWKAGVPRDAGAGWDFDDVRDHYLRLMFDLDPVALRSTDPDRYLALSRAVSGEVMADVFGEWRRRASPCHGGLVLWARDLVPGAGWGLLDHRGEPKLALAHLRRVLAPVAVWTTDEGLGGIDVHLANDGPDRLSAVLRVAIYAGAQSVGEAREELTLAPHGSLRRGIEAMLGRFVDVSWAYRFGPPGQDLVVATLHAPGRTGELGPIMSQAFRFPAGRQISPMTAETLGLTARVLADGAGAQAVAVRCVAPVHGVRLEVPGYRPSDDGFDLEPRHERIVRLIPTGEADGSRAPARGVLTALNLRGRAPITTPA